MPWPGISLENFVFILLFSGHFGSVFGEGNVGCLFSNRLCLENEWCFDDYAFGRCTSSGNVNDDDIFRYDLKREELHGLKRELERLFTLGYRWSHGYTQCRLQAMLYAVKHDLPFDEDSCSHLVDQDLEGALKAMDVQDPMLMDPREVAIIKYTPSVGEKLNGGGGGGGRYADEVFYPPNNVGAREALRNKILASNAVDIMDMPDPYAEYTMVKRGGREWIPQMARRAPPIITIKSTRDFANDDLEFLQPPAPPAPVQEDFEDVYPLLNFLNENQLTPHDLRRILSPKTYNQLEKLLERFEVTAFDQEDQLNELLEKIDENDVAPERFTPTYNTPDKFRHGWESKDTLYFLNQGSNPSEIFRELKNAHENSLFREQQRKYDLNSDAGTFGKMSNGGVVYTEGGVVYPEFNNGDEEDEDGTEKLLSPNYKRPERVDVKKPGPQFTTQDKDNELDYDHAASSYVPSMMKKGPRGAPHPNPHKLDLYDMEESNNADYVFVGFNRNFRTWGQGQEVIKNISNALHLEPSTFENGHVFGNMVTFKVLPNNKGLNASEVARKIIELKDVISPHSEMKIFGAGIKDNKAKMLAVRATPTINDNEFYVIIFMVCGVLGAMIIATALLIIIRRHLKSKEKLHGLAKPDTEASKDYQDLCRARMSKTQPSASGTETHGRITSLSKESEQSPSSRSSTSSWSEEPALHNMDISTGHIVLNYMEDHLKNKDRLEQEWEALCAYIAEPCMKTVALRAVNAGKNRYPDIVPYDHSRVVLNELTNINGSDYINASSITDHDPRNPAYIATQGPLPHTSADFWQLIWEQGAVVIVMLTRLTESGAAMCHRYWPEEGSELYHIYEVHLVSEHIWCDDYLVRSFYLKNVKTGETRTVTQFHFLSWPEGGVPASTKALLEFRRKVNKSYRGRSCPIVVHCSDGAGRTGTYCLIDMVLSRMAKGAKEIDIAATLEHLRDQRVKMVATKQQFEFVLTAVAEEVHAILKVLPPQPATSLLEKEK